jgi:hypothetical protein
MAINQPGSERQTTELSRYLFRGINVAMTVLKPSIKALQYAIIFI